MFNPDDHYAVRLQDFRDLVKDLPRVEVSDLGFANYVSLIIEIETGDHRMGSFVTTEGAKRGIIPGDIEPLSGGGVRIVFLPIEEYQELHVSDSGQPRGFQ